VLTATDTFFARQGNALTKLTETVKTLHGSLEFCLLYFLFELLCRKGRSPARKLGLILGDVHTLMFDITSRCFQT